MPPASTPQAGTPRNSERKCNRSAPSSAQPEISRDEVTIDQAEPGYFTGASTVRYKVVREVPSGPASCTFHEVTYLQMNIEHTAIVKFDHDPRKDKERNMNNDWRALRKLMVKLKFHPANVHFAYPIDYARGTAYILNIYPLLGPNLDQLRDNELGGKGFSTLTAAKFSLQALCAVRAIHSMGFVHGRLQPDHFCIGRTWDRNIIRLISFARCKREKSILTWKNARLEYSPRSNGNLTTTKEKEMETWFYLLLDLLLRERIPWKDKAFARDKAACDKMKNALLAEPSMIDLPVDICHIADIINTGEIGSKQLDQIESLIAAFAARRGDTNGPFEWEEPPEDVQNARKGLKKKARKEHKEFEKLIEEAMIECMKSPEEKKEKKRDKEQRSK